PTPRWWQRSPPPAARSSSLASRSTQLCAHPRARRPSATLGGDMSRPRSESEYLTRLIPPSAAAGISRRGFLKGTLGAGAAVSLSSLLAARGGGGHQGGGGG